MTKKRIFGSRTDTVAVTREGGHFMANNVGRNIRILRTRAGITQDQLAERLFVSRQTVSNYETGRSQPDVDTLVRLAEALGTDAGTLIYGPALPVQKKRQLQRCALGLGCLLVWSVLAFPVTQAAQEWKRMTYIGGFMFPLMLVAMPLLAATLGWTLLQLTTLVGAKQPTLVRRRLWHGLALGMGGAYLAWVLPVCIETVSSAIAAMMAQNAGTGYSYTGVLPGFFYAPVWFFSWHKPVLFALMFLLGAALWLTAAPPEKE